jgi:hypothetical protein
VALIEEKYFLTEPKVTLSCIRLRKGPVCFADNLHPYDHAQLAKRADNIVFLTVSPRERR